mgnify:CR=1 FL=1
MMDRSNIESVIFRYLSGDASREEKDLLHSWLNDSVENEKEFAFLKKLYVELETRYDDSIDTDAAFGRFRERTFEDKNSPGIENSPGKAKIRRVILFRRYAAAFMLLLATAVSAFLVGRRAPADSGMTAFEVRVPFGGKSSVILPDGSSVWLNAGSHLTYRPDAGSGTRDAFLEGEGLFTIEKDRHPFIVHTSHLDIHVTGTRFNVKSYPDDERIETTLLEGEIRIEAESERAPIYIRPHQTLSYQKNLKEARIVSHKEDVQEKKEAPASASAHTIEVISNVDVQEAVSWQTGIMHIEGCLLYTSPSPRDRTRSRMPSSA